MDWYIVVKTINGHGYYYKQKTWREGNRVRTKSVYLCPVYKGRPSIGGWSSGHPDLDGAVTLPIPFGQPVREPAFIDVNGALNALTGKPALSWDHAWSSHRLKREGNLVQHDASIDAALQKLQVTWSSRDSGCWYSPSKDTVNIPKDYRFRGTSQQTATQAYYIVVFHEVAHWTKKRVDRERFSGVGVGFRGEYAAEELVAELSALTLMRCFGMDVGDEARHAHYFQYWRDQLPGSERDAAVEYAKEEAARAVKYILEHGKVQL
jgi:hypothetical protein